MFSSPRGYRDPGKVERWSCDNVDLSHDHRETRLLCELQSISVELRRLRRSETIHFPSKKPFWTTAKQVSKMVKDADIVGAALARVLPDYQKPWYRVSHLLQLNLILIVPLLSSAVAGYDGRKTSSKWDSNGWL